LVDVALVGGAEELSEVLFACYDAVGGLNPIRVSTPEEVCPKPGGGLVLGEGAAVLVMEKHRMARQRGARVYADLLADTSTGDNADMGHFAKTAKHVIKNCKHTLDKAGIKPHEIDHVSVSANYARELDAMECDQLGGLFRGAIETLRVTPLKYLIGSFGAAGTTRVAAILLSLYHQISLPEVVLATLCAEQTAPIQWEPCQSKNIANALMTSSTFGGGTASLIFARSKRSIG